jgi:hypothetical protein
MAKKNREAEILTYLDTRIEHGTAAVASARGRLADPNASDTERREASGSLSVIKPRLADDKNLARQLRNGDINADDDNFATWRR